MASYESIGSCSLDVDVTASDSASELCNSESVSERTLHSLALSARTPGSTTPEYVKRTAKLFESSGSPDTDDLGKENYPEDSGVRSVLNAPQIKEADVNGCEATKKPSYLGLACSISGYTTITNYDSKHREGFRSRDHSPGRLVIRSREVSPLRSHREQVESAGLRFKSDCGNYLAPPRPPEKGVDRNGNALNGDSSRDEKKLDVRNLKNSRAVNGGSEVDSKMAGNPDDQVTSVTTLRESSRNFMSTMLTSNTFVSSSNFRAPASNYESPTKSKIRNGFQGGSSSETNGSTTVTTNGSSSRAGNPEELSIPDGCSQKRSPGAVRVVEFTSQTKSYVRNGQSAPALRSSTYTSSKFTDSKNQFLESKPPSSYASPAERKSDVVLSESRGHVNGNRETTSVWTGTPSNKSFIQQRVERLYGPGALAQGFFRRNGSSPCQSPYQGAHESSPHGSQSALPVLRHLRPEFRAQLCLGSRRESGNKENQVVKIIPVEYDKEVEVEKIFPTEERKTSPALQQQISVESISEHLPAAPEVVLPPQQVAAEILVSDASVVKDGRYFLSVLRQEIETLNSMVEAMEKDTEGKSIPEEASGQLRAALGQARLLVKQKLQQFEGLCHKNMAQDCEEPFPTTCEDLAGFWDMVKLQVDQVHAVFADLERLKAAGWHQETPSPTDEVDGSRKTSPKKRAPKSTVPAGNEAARKTREEARRKLMEDKRREMREKRQASAEEGVEIFVPQENGK